MRALLLLLLLSSPVLAIQLRVLPWDHELAERKLALAFGGKTVAIEGMHPSARSPALTIPPGAENLRLVDLEATGQDGGLLSHPLLLDHTLRTTLIVLVPSPKSPMGLRPFAMNDDPNVFRWGSFRFLNATGKKLVFVCEKKPVALGTNLVPQSFAPGGQSRNLPVKLYLHSVPEKPFYSSIWEYKDTLRQLVIVVPKQGATGEGLVDFKFVIEDRRDRNSDQKE